MPHATDLFRYDYVPETKEDLEWADREFPYTWLIIYYHNT